MSVEKLIEARLGVVRRAALAGVTLFLASVLAIGLAGFVLRSQSDLTTALIALALAGPVVACSLLFWGYDSLRDQLLREETDRQRDLSSANRDSLTGVLNRSQFLDDLRDELRRKSRSVAYVQLDLDHLKAINDGSGHAAGDAAIRHLVGTIEAIVPRAHLGRLGGDEFGLALYDCDSPKAVMRLCEQIREALKVPVSVAGRNIAVTATMGFARFPADAISMDDLISKADLALYRGKQQGRGRTVGFEPDMYADKRHARFIERELRAGVLLDELELFYQPIYATDGITLKGYEALVRWDHSVRGIISPAEFIHIAEQSDLIDLLGLWVFRRACLDQPELGDGTISVNVSVAQLRHADLAERFSDIVMETGADAGRLIVEVTESVPLDDKGTEAANLHALRQMGVRIAIDDFGAGNASLSYIKRFRFDIIKIDRSYIETIATSRLDAMMVGAICRIARAAEMEVVAEGVETREQLEALTATGCCSLQGYHLGRPQPLRLMRRGVMSEAGRPSAA